MVAPPSLPELLGLRATSNMADAEAAKKLAEKRRQLLAANKLAARALLLGVSTSGYSTPVRREAK